MDTQEQLEMEKVKRAIMALEDLLQSRIYDYYHGTFDGKMTKGDKYGFSDTEIADLKYSLEKFINNKNT